jgi:hypothetical protein
LVSWHDQITYFSRSTLKAHVRKTRPLSAGRLSFRSGAVFSFDGGRETTSVKALSADVAMIGNAARP